MSMSMSMPPRIGSIGNSVFGSIVSCFFFKGYYALSLQLVFAPIDSVAQDVLVPIPLPFREATTPDRDGAPRCEMAFVGG